MHLRQTKDGMKNLKEPASTVYEEIANSDKAALFEVTKNINLTPREF